MAKLPPKQKIIVILGPTASGKSDLGIKLAKKYRGEIISADSRQVYRGMDIGTGKVAKDRYKGSLCRNTKAAFVSKGIKHHLIDVASPKRQFTASDFKKLGEEAIKEILFKNKIPIIVGGTGLYTDVLLGRMQIAEAPPNKKLRARFDKLTAKKLFEKLQKMDPQRAKTIDHHNKRRIIRAIEIIVGAKDLKSKFTPHHSRVNTLMKNSDILYIGIKIDKGKLAKRIKKRLDERLQQGMIKEVERLHEQGVSWKRLDDLGLEYRWISRYLQGKIPRKETEEKLYRDIIKYSKRQMTWFKRNKDISWLKNSKIKSGLISRFLQH